MFICKECLEKEGKEFPEWMSKSYGSCEECGEVKPCIDTK